MHTAKAISASLFCRNALGLTLLLGGCLPQARLGDTADSGSDSCDNPVAKAVLMDLYADQICPLVSICNPNSWTEAECRASYAAIRDGDSLCVDECDAAECATVIQAVADCETYDAAAAADACYGLLQEDCE